MSTTKHTTIEQLKKLALRTKSEIGLVDAKVAGLTTKVNDLVTAGGEPNKLEGIKVNGTLLALTDKIADILIAEGKTNGTVSANGVDIPVHGLAALAYKSEVAESDLAAALNINELHTAEQFEGLARTDKTGKKHNLLGIFGNLSDYTVGSTKGGEITRFNQFDIDFNQEKYLIETRLSGALTRLWSAIALEEPVKASSGQTEDAGHDGI